jgi:hypothetical protein
MIYNLEMKKQLSIIAILVLINMPILVLAMESVNYKIDTDTLNSGGELSSSASFSAVDSIGDPFVGTGTSANFIAHEGFVETLVFGISLSLDSATKNLGTVTAGTPIVGTTMATVITDAWGGYDLAINQDKNMTHTDTATTIASYACSIASPCVWSATGFGFTVKSATNLEAKWYANPNYYYAAIPSSTTIFHTKNGYTSGGDSTEIEYKVDVPTAQKSGVYANTVTYIATAKI